MYLARHYRNPSVTSLYLCYRAWHSSLHVFNPVLLGFYQYFFRSLNTFLKNISSFQRSGDHIFNLYSGGSKISLEAQDSFCIKRFLRSQFFVYLNFSVSKGNPGINCQCNKCLMLELLVHSPLGFLCHLFGLTSL